jgi:ABC-type dipeptide/oligopeptide/nickel transport system permease component
MQRYILGRVAQLFVSLLVVVTFVFLLSRLSGDPVQLMLDVTATEQDKQALRVQLGLDQPLAVQYVVYLRGMVMGDFGRSVLSRRPVLEHIWERLPNTLTLGAVAIVISIVIGVPVGVYSAVKRGTALDHGARVVAVMGQAVPTFWLGIMLILVFGVWLGWLPPGGKAGPESYVLPALTLGYFTAAAIMRLTRSSMLEVLGAEYVKFARIKGLRERVVVWKHALKNATIPVLTFSVMLFVIFLGGAVVTETVFAWPGLGRLILEGINTRDYPIVQGGVMVFSAIYLLANLMVDVLYSYFNPKIRYARPGA